MARMMDNEQTGSRVWAALCADGVQDLLTATHMYSADCRRARVVVRAVYQNGCVGELCAASYHCARRGRLVGQSCRGRSFGSTVLTS
jgi:hypothetical protein